MSLTLKTKELVNTRLASGHGGWVYCDSCGEHGSMHLAFEDDSLTDKSDQELIMIKNRLCCPNDNSPLFTILYKKLESCK